MNETMQTIFRVLVVFLLGASILAAGLMSPGTKSMPPYSKAYLQPTTLVRNEDRAGFSLVVENHENREVTYTVMYHAGGFFLSRDDFALKAGEMREIVKDFDLVEYGLTSPIKISIQVFSQDKRYNLFYWA